MAADSGRARIFTAATPTAALDEKEVMLNPEARNPERDLTTDAPGRAHKPDQQRAGMGSSVDPKEHEAMMFAKQLARRLYDGRTHGEYDRLVLIAAPAFLGMLRENLDKHVLEQVSLSMDKDFSQMRADELRARLPKRLA